MSASSKKKFRREEDSSKMTERQRAEAKEAKKLKVFTITFCVVLAVILVAFVSILVSNSGIIQQNVTALTIGSHKISAVELNYYYLDGINSYVKQNGSYLSLFGLDATKSLDSQVYNQETGATWADAFLEQAESSARSTYALYDAAMAEGYTLSEEDKASIDSSINVLKVYAPQSGYGSFNGYMRAVYGAGASEKSYRKYCEVQSIATAYYNDHQESLTYDDAALREAEAENYDQYSSYTYQTCWLSRTNFLEGGTKDEEGNTTYSDVEYRNAEGAARRAAMSMIPNSVDSVEKFDEAYAALSINEGKEDVTSTANKDVIYSSVPEVLRKWVTDSHRKEGDKTFIANTTTAEDGTVTTTGYYVVYFVSSTDNTFPLANVRHILVSYEGGTKDGTTGVTTYTDEEKAAAKEKAEALLEEWKNGEATEDSFATLANDKSTDPGSNTNGGLYEKVYPGQMVANFNDWCFAEGRQPGDTGIVESDNGYHVMYYSGDADITYRDYMITNALTSQDMQTWYTGLVEGIAMTVKNTSFIRRDVVLQSSSAI